MAKEIIKENLKRYAFIQDNIKKFSEISPLIYSIVTGGEAPYRDAIAFVFLPPVLNLSKESILPLTNMLTPADDICLRFKDGNCYLRIVVKNVWTEGLSIPTASDMLPIEDKAIEAFKKKQRGWIEEALNDLKGG